MANDPSSLAESVSAKSYNVSPITSAVSCDVLCNALVVCLAMWRVATCLKHCGLLQTHKDESDIKYLANIAVYKSEYYHHYLCSRCFFGTGSFLHNQFHIIDHSLQNTLYNNVFCQEGRILHSR